MTTSKTTSKTNSPAGAPPVVALALALLLALPALLLAAPSAAPVEERLLSLRDISRARDIPVKLYLPADHPRPPVIILSTGLGATCRHYAYLARHWAGRGYAVFVLQHPGSDDAIFRKPWSDPFWAVMRAAVRKRNWIDRPLDVRFLIDHIVAVSSSTGPAFDKDRIGLAGHSFGAYTALAVAGLRVDFPGGAAHPLADPRIRAVVSMSFPGDMGGALGPDAFTAIALPVLHFSGTRDDTPMLGSWAPDRRIPFDRTPAPDQYLVTIAGADHFALADNEIGLDGREVRRNPAVHQNACVITTVFWDAFLRSDPAARDWLRRTDLAAATRGLCTLETRPPSPRLPPRE